MVQGKRSIPDERITDNNGKGYFALYEQENQLRFIIEKGRGVCKQKAGS